MRKYAGAQNATTAPKPARIEMIDTGMCNLPVDVRTLPKETIVLIGVLRVALHARCAID